MKSFCLGVMSGNDLHHEGASIAALTRCPGYFAAGYEMVGEQSNSFSAVVQPISSLLLNALVRIAVADVVAERFVREMDCYAASCDGGSFARTPDKPRRRAELSLKEV